MRLLSSSTPSPQPSTPQLFETVTKIVGSLFEQRLDQVVRDAVEPETADRERRAARNVGDGLGAGRVDLLHADAYA